MGRTELNASQGRPTRRKLLKAGAGSLVVPFTFASGKAPDIVTMKNVEAARAATEHMIATGRRRILAFGAHENEVIGSAGLRLRGFRQAS